LDCVYHAQAPRSPEAQIAWDIFQGEAWRIKTAGMGVIVGVDLDVAYRRCARAGIDPEIAEDLLAACERGFVTAITEQEDSSGTQD
jgi:hypothetical protein